MSATGGASVYAVRPIQAADAAAVRALFQRVFDKEMSQALWEWKYARPQSAAFGVWRGDELVAHYGGFGMQVYFKGQPATAMQIGDVMVDPGVRQGVRTHSPIFLVTSAFLERHLGYGKAWLLGYGFPNERAMGIAARLGCYAPVGRMWELDWDLREQPRMPWLLKAEVLGTQLSARQHAALDALGAQQARDMPERILVRKDAAFVERRYLRHPHERYTALLIRHRLTQKAVGLCVLKVEAERVLWMEALGPLGHMPALAQVARAATWLLGKRKLSLWCSEPDAGRFGTVSRAQGMAVMIPANVWSPGPSPEELQNRWWLLAGDTDYL